MKRVGIIGLGRIGMPSTTAFIKAGYEVLGYGRRPEVIEKFKSLGGKAASSPKEVAERAETVIILVLNDQQVIEVATGPNGILEGTGNRSKVICMSTINRDNLEWVARQCQERGVAFVDCPFTGGPARVEKGTLTLIVAAPSTLVEEVRPVLEVLGKINPVGETPGVGQSVKHCNQLLVCVTHAAVMETILLAKKLGLDPHKVCEIVGSGIGGSDYFRLLSKSVLDKTPSPGGLGQLCKDIGIVSNTARKLKLPLYVTTSAYQYFLAAEALGLGLQEKEGADLMKVVERISEVEG
jgi:3-hydroxyisobutyrate dehydrogenase-like beta-hydroxyacid dehydrogenase